MDYLTISSIDEIEKLPVSEAAKHQIKELYEFCNALGGTLTVTPPRKDIDYPFADVTCRLSSPKRFNEIRVSGNGRIEFFGDKWKSLWLAWGIIKPNIVLRLTGKKRAIEDIYFDNIGGIDYVDGDLEIKTVRAAVNESGVYVNMEVV